MRAAAERKHRVSYPELQRAQRCRLTVLALEVGGRWGEETEAFLHRIAQGRALASPAAQRTAVAAAYRRRWGQMLAAQGAFVASLCQLPTDVGDAYAGIILASSSNYALRIIPPELTDFFCPEHDAEMFQCNAVW